MMTKSVLLPLAPEAAFALFTEKISVWWPENRRHTNDAQSQLFLLASGRFYEVSKDGKEVDLGKVTAWEPPHRIVLDFYVATGPEAPTEATITFTPEDGGTRVNVLHGPMPESQHLWKDRAPRYAQSWQVVLEALLEASPSTD